MAKEFTHPLAEFIERYSLEIDKACEEIHPRVFSKKYLQNVSKSSEYKDISDYLTKSLGEPNWDLLDRKRSRIRPIIFLLTIGGLGKDPKNYVKYSSIIELIHNGTLIHDDIEDNAIKRRNKKPLHLKYGLDIAVNSANLMYFSPFYLLKKYKKEIPWNTLIRAYEVISEHLNRVTWGQALDIYWHKNDIKVNKEDYLQMCCYKTGAIDRLTTSLASIFAQTNSNLHKKIEDFGEDLGIGFQIHDDFLDVCATKRDLFGGKPKGNDISEGKKSLVNILTIESLPKQKRQKFKEILLERTFDKTKLEEALKLIEESGALEKVLNLGKNQFIKLQNLTSNLLHGTYQQELYQFLKGMEKDFEDKYEERE